MERMRSSRLDRERQALVLDRKPIAIRILRAFKISCLPFTQVMPEPVDFCAFPEVRDILELPNDVDVDESTFSEVARLLPDICERWRADIIKKLATRVRQAEEDEKTSQQDEQISMTESDLLLRLRANAFEHVSARIRQLGVTTVSESDLPSMMEYLEADAIENLIGAQRAQEDEQTLELDDQATSHKSDPADSTAQISPLGSRTADTIEKMKLATTVFKCRRCAEKYCSSVYRTGDISRACHRPPGIPDVLYPLFYPQILGHRCLTVQENDHWYLQDGSDPIARLFMDSSPFGVNAGWRRRQHWDCLCLAVDVKSGERVEKIVTVCGLDPATATAQDLDELDARLGCPDCLRWLYPDEDIARMNTYGWRSAVSVISQTTVFSYNLVLLQ